MHTHLRIGSARALLLTEVATSAAFATAQVRHEPLVSLNCTTAGKVARVIPVCMARTR